VASDVGRKEDPARSLVLARAIQARESLDAEQIQVIETASRAGEAEIARYGTPASADRSGCGATTLGQHGVHGGELRTMKIRSLRRDL